MTGSLSAERSSELRGTCSRKRDAPDAPLIAVPSHLNAAQQSQGDAHYMALPLSRVTLTDGESSLFDRIFNEPIFDATGVYQVVLPGQPPRPGMTAVHYAAFPKGPKLFFDLGADRARQAASYVENTTAGKVSYNNYYHVGKVELGNCVQSRRVKIDFHEHPFLDVGPHAYAWVGDFNYGSKQPPSVCIDTVVIESTHTCVLNCGCAAKLTEHGRFFYVSHINGAKQVKYKSKEGVASNKTSLPPATKLKAITFQERNYVSFVCAHGNETGVLNRKRPMVDEDGLYLYRIDKGLVAEYVVREKGKPGKVDFPAVTDKTISMKPGSYQRLCNMMHLISTGNDVSSCLGPLAYTGFDCVYGSRDLVLRCQIDPSHANLRKLACSLISLACHKDQVFGPTAGARGQDFNLTRRSRHKAYTKSKLTGNFFRPAKPDN